MRNCPKCVSVPARNVNVCSRTGLGIAHCDTSGLTSLNINVQAVQWRDSYQLSDDYPEAEGSRATAQSVAQIDTEQQLKRVGTKQCRWCYHGDWRIRISSEDTHSR